MEKRYGALRIIAGIYIYGSMLVFALMVAISIANVILSRYPSVALGGALVTIGLAALSTLGLVAFGQLIRLLISLEENSRASTALLTRLVKLQAANSNSERLTMVGRKSDLIPPLR